MTPTQIRRSDGTLIDARFSVELIGGHLSVVIESRGGTRGKSTARNADYAEGVELILKRLRALACRIIDGFLESRATTHLSREQRRLTLDGMSYPLSIGDPGELGRRLGAAQARIGREPNARGGGNRTKRIRLLLGFEGMHPSLPILAATLAGADQPSPLPMRAPDCIGQPFSDLPTDSQSSPRNPFEVDPDKVDRGTRAHSLTVNALAGYLRSVGIEPQAPTSGDLAEFDLAWTRGEELYVAEIKSVTRENEEKQLRLGLGQVLRYRSLLQKAGRTVIAVLVPERAPTDDSWRATCSDSNVVLAWPDAFDVLGGRAPAPIERDP